MKKFTATLLLAISLIGLASCGNKEGESPLPNIEGHYEAFGAYVDGQSDYKFVESVDFSKTDSGYTLKLNFDESHKDKMVNNVFAFDKTSKTGDLEHGIYWLKNDTKSGNVYLESGSLTLTSYQTFYLIAKLVELGDPFYFEAVLVQQYEQDNNISMDYLISKQYNVKHTGTNVTDVESLTGNVKYEEWKVYSVDYKENRFYVSSKTQPIASFDVSIPIVHNNLVKVTDLYSNFVVNICEKGFALITFDTKTFNGFYNIYCYTVID